MGVTLVVILIIFLGWPWISKWLGRLFSWYMSRKAEDMMRRMMGMPSRSEERKARRKAEREQDQGATEGPERSWGRKRTSGQRYHRPAREDAADLMRSVAEDVDYTEIREFESTHIAVDRNGERTTYDEEQVSDAEYTEIKK